MSLKVEEKGYIRRELNCLSCSMSITLYTKDVKGNEVVMKSPDAEILGVNRLRHHSCEAILSYQPQPKPTS